MKYKKAMTDKEAILKLKDGECYIVPESDYGRCEIWLKHGYYFLFEIPIYGGPPNYFSDFPVNQIDRMIQIYESWT